MANQLVFAKIPMTTPGFEDDGVWWRVHLKGFVQIGGTGRTPEEALGLMVLSNPGRFGVDDLTWKNKAPKCGHDQYPAGPQPIYERGAVRET